MIFKYEFVAGLYEANGPMTLSRVLQKVARIEYMTRIAFDMPNSRYPREKMQL